MHGSGTLIRWLLDNELVDEINLLTFPVVVGQDYAAVPRYRPGQSARTSRIAGHPQRGDDPSLPAYRALAVWNGHGRHEARELNAATGGP